MVEFIRKLKFSKIDRLFLLYIAVLAVFLSFLIPYNFLFSDEGTHLLLSVFYRDLFSHAVQSGGMSLGDAYQFGVDYLVSYPKLQIAYPPVYHFTTALFFSIFGLSEVVGRFVALIYAVLAFAVFYLIIKKYFGGKTAFLSTALFSFSSYSLFYSSRAMQDFAVYFWLLLSVYIFSVAMERKQLKYFALSGILAAIAALSKQMGGFVLVFFILVVALSKVPFRDKLKNIIVLLLFSSLLLLPYLFVLDSVGGFEINKLVAVGYAVKGGQPLSLMEPYFWTYYLVQLTIKYPVFWVFFGVFLFYVYRKRPHWKFILLWFLVFYICLSLIPHKVPRFFNFFFLPAYISAGYYLLAAEKKVKYLSCILLALYFVFSLSVFMPTVGHFPSDKVAEYAYENIPAGGNIALLSDEDPLFSSVVMWHLRKLDENRTIAVYRPCLFDNKTGREMLNILDENNIYFIIYLKGSRNRQIEKIIDELELDFELEYNNLSARIYRYKNFVYKKQEAVCNYVCLTRQKICKGKLPDLLT
jgi:4-amino-4-deoxy-L-arabinose transferase-like glycosyltransferase